MWKLDRSRTGEKLRVSEMSQCQLWWHNELSIRMQLSSMMCRVCHCCSKNNILQTSTYLFLTKTNVCHLQIGKRAMLKKKTSTRDDIWVDSSYVLLSCNKTCLANTVKPLGTLIKTLQHWVCLQTFKSSSFSHAMLQKEMSKASITHLALKWYDVQISQST